MPTDPTPHAGQVMERPPEPEYPEPKPDATGGDRPDEPEQSDRRSGQPSRVDPLTGAGEDIAG